MDSDAHVTALLTHLDAATAGTSLSVHERPAPNFQQAPYWLVDPEGPGIAHRGSPAGAPKLGVQDQLDLVVQITAVGATQRQARWAASKAQDAMVDTVLTVAGRTCDPIVQEFSTGRPAPDVTDPDLFVSMAGYRIRSVPS